MFDDDTRGGPEDRHAFILIPTVTIAQARKLVVLSAVTKPESIHLKDPQLEVFFGGSF